jgi:hypothetical protein
MNNQFKFNSTSSALLNIYGMNKHSQNGEDGVIAEILLRLGLIDAYNSWCVEFGAWDGVYLSNTFTLVEMGWKGIYIEGNPDRFQELLQTVKKFPRITPIRAFVNKRSSSRNSLDNLLSKTGIPKDFHLLSIDVDSYDFDIWKSLKNYAPKIVVIEINSSVAPGILWTHGYKTPGNTFTSTVRLGIDKGYKLVCHTGNLIFVRNDLVSKLNIQEKYLNNPNLLFMNSWTREGLYSHSRFGTGRVLKVKGFFREIFRI